MELLSRSINIAVDHNHWLPITLNKKAPPISHLFFADDIILASKITTNSCHTIIDHLNHFTTLSGHRINFAKSKIFFSKNCSQHTKSFILGSFNMVEGTHFGKYLGFPIFTSKPSKNDFQYIIDSFKYRLAGWKTNHLTLAGRATLIKSTLNSIPNHLMQLIKIPNYIIQRMEQYQKNFLWVSNAQRKRMHMVKWEVITTLKSQGRLGIQKLKAKNLALLASTAWRLFQNQQSHWASILLSKYGHSQANNPRNSTLWKHLMLGWNVCQQGSVWQVTRGTKINFWQDI